eukprot:745756_1
MSQCSVFHQGVIQLHLYLNAIDYLTHKQHHYSSANAVASPDSTEAYIAGMIRNKSTKYHESTHLLAMINHIHSPLIPSAKSEIKIGSHTLNDMYSSPNGRVHIIYCSVHGVNARACQRAYVYRPNMPGLTCTGYSCFVDR